MQTGLSSRLSVTEDGRRAGAIVFSDLGESTSIGDMDALTVNGLRFTKGVFGGMFDELGLVFWFL